MIQDDHPGSGSRISILISFPSLALDPEVKKAPYPGSETLFHRDYDSLYIDEKGKNCFFTNGTRKNFTLTAGRYSQFACIFFRTTPI